jgi:hypothetical protein
MIYGFNESIPVHEDCYEASIQGKHKKISSSSSSSSNALLVRKNFMDTGWDRPIRYFLSPDLSVEQNGDALPPKKQHQYDDTYEIIQQIQQSVLGVDHYHAGPSLFDYDNSYRSTITSIWPWAQPSPIEYRLIQVLILDRKFSARDFANVNDTIRALHNYTFNHSSVLVHQRDPTRIRYMNQTAPTASMTQFRLNVTYISSFYAFTLFEQAYVMHHADIIYSPHGAQLSNLIYIRPCTVSVEFFPRAYYLQFFQTLALSAHGLSYEGYPSATINFTDKVRDSKTTAQDQYLRYTARNTRTSVASDFFIRTLPQLMDATIQCRTNYYRKM